MRLLKIYFSLPSAERSALHRAWILILICKILLHISKLPTLTAFINSHVKPAARVQSVAPQRLAEIAGIAGRKTYGSTCLHRSLALLVLLRRQGTPARLAIGVNHESGFAAHAWVEVEAAEPLKLHGHPAEGHYTRLLEYEL